MAFLEYLNLTSTGDMKGWETPRRAGTSSRDMASLVMAIVIDLKKSWINFASSVESSFSLVTNQLGSYLNLKQ